MAYERKMRSTAHYERHIFADPAIREYIRDQEKEDKRLGQLLLTT
jgi:hypothetical protein